MDEPRTLRLQRALASLVLDGDEASLEDDPSLPARRQGLSFADQQCFRDQGAALLVYRELARLSLIEPLEEMFPVLKALLEEAGGWDTCIQAFLEARLIRSGHYRDIAPSFLGWLAATRWGQNRWPYLLELAHFELLEVLVARFPESDPPEGLHAHPSPHDQAVLDPSSQIVSYAHAVHCVTEQSPIPDARATHLLAFRDKAGQARLKELTPATAALLVRVRTERIGSAASALNLEPLSPVLNLLLDLHREGAVAGFQSAN